VLCFVELFLLKLFSVFMVYAAVIVCMRRFLEVRGLVLVGEVCRCLYVSICCCVFG